MRWWKPLAFGLSLALMPSWAIPTEAAKKSKLQQLKPMPAWTELAKKGPAGQEQDVQNTAMDQKTLSAWWETFNDPQLNQLIDKTLQNNRDLQAAQARVEQARAQLGISKGEMLPWLNAGGTWVRGQIPDSAAEPLQDMSRVPGVLRSPKLNDQAAGLGIDASWEIDFFGRLKEGKRAAAHNLAAQQGALYSAWVTLSAETALNYISLRTLQQDLAIVQRHSELEGEKVELLDDNYQAGLASAYPVEVMKTQQQSTQAEIPALQQSIQETLTRLTILTGSEPGQLSDLLEPAPLPKVDATLYNAIPADKLRQRPDIYAAEQRVLAQVAKTKQAKAELKPRFTLEGFLGLITFGGGNLFSSKAYSFAIAPSMTMPLFHGGVLRQNVKLQDARTKQYQAEYENTVLKAAGEVQDAMTSIALERERKENLTAGRESAQQAFDLAENRYQAGLSDYQPVLDSERTLLKLKRQENRSKGQELADMIHLFKSLGGGWQPLEEAQLTEVANAGGKEK